MLKFFKKGFFEDLELVLPTDPQKFVLRRFVIFQENNLVLKCFSKKKVIYKVLLGFKTPLILSN